MALGALSDPMLLVRVLYVENCIFICNIPKKTDHCRIYTKTLSRVKDVKNVKGLENTKGNTWSSVKNFSPLTFKLRGVFWSCTIMIIPLKVNLPASLENTFEMSLETTQRASSFDG